MTARRAATDTMFDVLQASQPDADLAPRLSLFGQFVGSWTVDLTNYHPDGGKDTVPGEWHFGWVLEGRAVQDVFIAPRRGIAYAGPYREYGTTIRFYDPTVNVWRITWSGPVRGRQIHFIARPGGDEIVLEGTEHDTRLRWIFSEIGADSFHWRALESVNDGESWHLVQEMHPARDR